MATTQDFATWTCGPRLDPRYLLLVLRAMKPEWERLAFGSTHKTIYMPDIEALRIPLPPIEEQCRIADFLDAETVLVDGLAQQRTRQRELLDELKQSATDDAVARLPECARPRLGYLARVQTGVTVDGSRRQVEGGIARPYLRVANVQVGFLDLNEVAEMTVSHTTAAASRLRTGDVLMTEGGDLDKLGRGTVWRGEIEYCMHQNHVFAVRPDQGNVKVCDLRVKSS